MKDSKARIGNCTFVNPKEIPGNNGEAHCLTQTIYLRNDMPPLATRNVFIHEAVHAISGAQGRLFTKKIAMAWRFNEIQGIIETYEDNQTRI